MAVVKVLLSIIYVVLGIAISVVILMQEGKSNGLEVPSVVWQTATGARIKDVLWKELWSILPDTVRSYL